MDFYMDKLADKLNAQEMIAANKAADAEELRRLENQLKEYEKCLEQMCQLKQELKDSADKISKGLKDDADEIGKQLQEKIECFEQNQQGIVKLQKSVEDALSKSNEHVHKESVKVYRNVQAVILDESVKQSELLKQLIESMEEVKAKVNEQKPTPGIIKGILWVSVLSMLLSMGTLTYLILLYLNII